MPLDQNTVSITDLEDPESQVVPWADNDHFESLKRKRAESASESQVSSPEAEDHDEEVMMPVADIDIDVEMGEEMQTGQSAVRLTTQASLQLGQ